MRGGLSDKRKNPSDQNDTFESKAEFLKQKFKLAGISSSKARNAQKWLNEPNAFERETGFRIAFALNLTIAETDEFFRTVLLDRSFDCHTIEEAIYYYCIFHGKDYPTAERLIDSLYDEIRQLIDMECLPYSEIRHGFAVTMGFYWAEVEQNQEKAEKWIAAARSVAEKRYPIALDYIDFMIVPLAIIYIDLRNYAACEDVLREGIRICDDYPELSVYRRKKHDLQRCLLDVYLEGNEFKKARKMISILDEECSLYGFPDTVQGEVRQYLDDSI